MNLENKDKITDPLIKSSDEYNNDSEYIKGFFTDVEEIVDNNDFLEKYRYLQYWKLPISEDMTFYASIPNYSPISLIENMRLTGEDSYFQYFVDLINNKDNKYKCKDCISLLSEEKTFTNLAVLDRADLTQEYLEEGCVPSDIYVKSDHGNSALEIVKTMMSEGYIPSDEIIIWYSEKCMGGLAKVCITECTDDFVFEGSPSDYDFLEVIIERKYNGILPSEIAEKFLFDCLESENKVDVAMFKKLYLSIDELSVSTKLMILNLVLKRDEPMLISFYLKQLDSEEIDRNRVSSVIIYNAKSKTGYLIYSIEILGNTNYQTILDVCDDIAYDDTGDYYQEQADDNNDLINEKFCEISSDSDDNSNSDYEEVEENEDDDLPPEKYGWNDSDDDF